MQRIPVCKVMMVRDGSLPAENKSVHSPADAHKILAAYLQGVDREHFVVLLLNTKKGVIGIHTVAVGTLNASLIHPREVFKTAILANCSSIILAHNHPSGDPLPSDEDVQITTRLIEAGKILGIPVVDHVIIGDGNYFSFSQRGLL